MSQKPLISFSIADLPINIDIEEMFKLAKELKIAGVEIVPGLKTFPHQKKLAFLSSHYKVAILSIHQPFYKGFGSITTNESLQLAKLFNAKYVIHPMPSNSLFSNKTKKYFQWYQQKAKEYNLEILVENMPKTYVLPIIKNFQKAHPSTVDISNLKKFCDQYNFGITLDTSHLMSEIPQDTTNFKKINKYIKNIHLSDFDKKVQHLSLGKGKMNVESFLKYLERTEYNGLITLELSPKIFVKKRQYIDDIKSSVNMIRKYLYVKN